MSAITGEGDGPQGLPPAGWCPTSSGALRWWDGRSWGPAAPPPPAPPRDSHLWAMLSHFGLVAMSFVGPLILRLTIGKEDEYVRHHSTEALNAQLTFMVVWNVAGIGSMVLAGVTHNDWFTLGLVLMPLALVWIVGTSIVGAVKAWRGEWWRYPGVFRFVRVR